MGMFDSFYMKGILMPDMQTYDDEFQTKALDCNLDQYVVTPDGRLMKRRMEIDTVIYDPEKLTGSVYLRGPIDITASFVNGMLSTITLEN